MPCQHTAILITAERRDHARMVVHNFKMVNRSMKVRTPRRYQICPDTVILATKEEQAVHGRACLPREWVCTSHVL